jgi:hypothetical protein
MNGAQRFLVISWSGHPPVRKSFPAIRTQVNTDELDVLETDSPLIQALLKKLAKVECYFYKHRMMKWTYHRLKTRTGHHTGK